jgi:hypothetical protein
MTSLILRRATGSAIACVLGLACSGKKAPVPDAFVLAYVGPGTGSSSICGYQYDTTFVNIGSPLAPKPSTVTNGDFQQGAQGGVVSLDCSVDGSGSFKIKINAEISGMAGGSLSLVGQVSATGGTGIYGGFTSGSNGSFIDPNCSITYTYNNEPVPINGSPIAGGRIWGHVDCPNAKQSGSTEIGDDGGSTERTCDAHADFLFENCN